MSSKLKLECNLILSDAECTFFVRQALRVGFIVEEGPNLTKSNRWFLKPIQELWILKRSWSRIELKRIHLTKALIVLWPASYENKPRHSKAVLHEQCLSG